MSSGNFGSWLSLQLRRQEWNESEFARRVGVQPSVVSRWVRNERQPNTKSVERIADVLSVDPDLVLTLAGHRPNIEDLKLDDPRTDLIARIRRVQWNAERESIVRGVLDSMIKAGNAK